MNITCELGPQHHGRIDFGLSREGTHELVIGDVTFRASLDDIEDLVDDILHDLATLKAHYRGANT